MLENDILIHEVESVKDALKKLDKTAKKTLLVVDTKNRLLGTITDGDIRRYILGSKDLNNDIREVYNKKPIYIKKRDFSIEAAKTILIDNEIELIPIVDEKNKVLDFISWNQAFSEDGMTPFIKNKIDIPVVIMAGGQGARLEPFTKIFPKALIPVGDKPIIEIIINEFKKYGVKEYYLTLNIKGEMIESYFNNIEKDYDVRFVREEQGFLGTAGSLKFLEDQIKDNFIVSNCDVIVKTDFNKVLNFHKEQGASLTVLSSMQYYKIPYGVIKFKEGGAVTDIHEKPEHIFPINSGVYILNKESLSFIPDESSFDMTDLIRSLIKNDKKVFMYPVNESDYIDIGQWGEYKKATEKLRFFG